MADNSTSSAYGASKGLSYTLPWDAMMQYNSQVEAQKQGLIAQNEQKMGKIVEMEKEVYTAIPTYDKALEDHYEQLHFEMGKTISKYRDPFSSIEGMRAMKDISAKYLNNEFISNYTQTKEAHDRLKTDYANERITESDFQLKEAEYQAFANGDYTKSQKKVFEYGRPDYTQITEINKTLAGDFDRVFNSKSGSVTTEGYSDDQFAKMYELGIMGKHKDNYIMEINRNLRKKQGIEINEETQKAEGIRLLKLQFPRRDEYYHQRSSGEGNAGKSYKDTQTYNDIMYGDMNPNDIPNHVAKADDTSIANFKHVSFGEGFEQYSFATNDAKYKIISASDYDQESFMAKGKVMTTRQNVVSGFFDKISNASKPLFNAPKGVFIFEGDNTAPGISQDQFYALGKSMGYSTNAECDAIFDKYKNGDYEQQNVGLSGKRVISNKGTTAKYSANPFLYEAMSQVTRSVDAEKDFTPAFKTDMENILGFRGEKDFVYLDNVNVPVTMNVQANDKQNSINAPEAQRQWTAMQNQLNVPDYLVLGGGRGVALTRDGTYNGIFDVNAGIHSGEKGLNEVLTSPLRDSFVDYFNRIEKRHTKAKSPKFLIREVFKGLNYDGIKAQINNGGEGSVYSLAEQLKKEIKSAKIKQPEPGTKEYMVLKLAEEFDSLP